MYFISKILIFTNLPKSIAKNIWCKKYFSLTNIKKNNYAYCINICMCLLYSSYDLTYKVLKAILKYTLPLIIY